MLKKLGVVLSFLCCSMIASTALAASNNTAVTPKQDTRQYYKSSSLVQTAEENVANGRGTLNGLMAFVRGDATDDDAIKEIGFMSLAKGNYIGLHAHSNTEEAYIILSGTGLLSDGKTERIVSKGDITIARVGQQHGLRNIGRDPLLFISILVKNDGNTNTKNDYIENSTDKRQQVRHDVAEPRGQLAPQRDRERQNAAQKTLVKERQDTVQKAQADTKVKAVQEREQKVKEAKKSREEAKKDREEQREKARKAKADKLAQREIDRENARLAREKARQEAKNPKTAEQRSREAELRAAKEEEAIWAAKQRDRIRAENPTELNDEFAIGIK